MSAAINLGSLEKNVAASLIAHLCVLSSAFLYKKPNYIQGRNHRKMLAATSAMVGRICPPWLR